MTAPASFSPDWLVPHLPDFLRAHPDIRLELDLSDRKADLVAEAFDLALRIGPLDDSSYALRRIARMRTLLCAAPSFLAGAGPIDSPADLAERTCVVDRNYRDGPRWSLEKAGETVRVSVHPRIESHGAACVRLAEAGLGVIREPEFLVAASLQAGRLTPVLPDWTLEEAPVALLFPSGRRIPHRVRALADHIAARFRKPAWEAPQAR